MNTLVIAYIAYLAISVGFTVWVARTLSKNGRVFLVDVFAGRNDLADSVNHLLVVGFYLINLGFIALALKAGVEIVTAAEGIELLARKIGRVLLVLGFMHFFNLFIFSRMRRRTTLRTAPPPVEPDKVLGGEPGAAASC